MIRIVQCAAVILAAMVGIAALMVAFSFLSPEVQIAAFGAFERIWIALIGNVAAVAGAIGAISATVLTILNGRKATAAVKAAEGAQDVAVTSRAELSAKLDSATAAVSEKVDHVATVAIPMAHTAGERRGVVIGIEEGKKQATGPATLGK